MATADRTPRASRCHNAAQRLVPEVQRGADEHKALPACMVTIIALNLAKVSSLIVLHTASRHTKGPHEACVTFSHVHAGSWR